MTAGVRLSHRLRTQFVNYFVEKHGHEYIKYSSVIPENDSTLGFVNAGMNQFKQVFLSQANGKQSLKRACNYQKCIRVGGKLCDLNTVGKDFRHHSFFEMLGNWSFNDYGKEEACFWAWDYLTSHLKLDIKRLFVTYYGGTTKQDIDTETKDIWQSLGVKPERIIENRTGDNFWEMGPTGPCGKSTEIFYLLEPCQLNLTSHDIQNSLEIWNIVFINLLRADNGQLVDLNKNYIDTGMGLERITSVLQNVKSNYDTDLFSPLFYILQKATNCESYSGSLNKDLDVNYRTLVDHARMITISLSDGLKPGRRGAANDLRQIIKKSIWIAIRNFKSDRPKYLLFDLVDGVVDTLKDAYPELESNVSSIRRTLHKEYTRFTSTHEKVQTKFYQLLKDQPKHNTIFDGKLAYKLHVEDGALVEHIDVLCKRNNKEVDWKVFELCRLNRLADSGHI